MKKSLILITCLLTLLIIFTSCENSSIKKENQIKDDLSIHSYMQENFPDFEIDNISIIKRQTNTEDKIDLIHVDVKLISLNTDCCIEGNIDLILKYSLYNDGWILDSCELDEKGINNGAKFFYDNITEITNDEVLILLDSICDSKLYEVNIINRETDFENGTDTYQITAKRDFKYCKEVVHFELCCVFDNTKGKWQKNCYEVGVISCNWNIAGKYSYTTEFGTQGEINIFGDTPTIQTTYTDRFYHTKAGREIYSKNHMNNIYNTNNIPLGQFVYNTFLSYRDDIKEGYHVILNEFEYHDFVYAFSSASENGSLDYIFIGKDCIAIRKDEKRDHYNEIIRIELCELTKIE